MSEPPMHAINALYSADPLLIAAREDQITPPSLEARPLCPKCAMSMFLARSQRGRSSYSTRAPLNAPSAASRKSFC